MNDRSKKHWAYEKVREFAPASKEKVTLLAIANYANPDGGHAWPSIDTIARDTGQTARTVQRHIRALEVRDELIVYRSPGGRHGSNRYQINWKGFGPDAYAGIEGVSRNQLRLPLAAVSPSVSEVAGNGDIVTPAEGQEVVNTVTACHPTNHEPIILKGERGNLILKKQMKIVQPTYPPIVENRSSEPMSTEDLHEYWRIYHPDMYRMIVMKDAEQEPLQESRKRRNTDNGYGDGIKLGNLLPKITEGFVQQTQGHDQH